jgi:hypothetical protein
MLRKMIPIGCADQWDNYVRSAMKSQFQSLDVVVHRVLVDHIPLGLSPPMGEQAFFEPPVLERDVDADVPPTVPDAQSAPNDVAHPPQEIPLTQNHPSKCQIGIVLSLYLKSLLLIHFSYHLLLFVAMLEETFPIMRALLLLMPKSRLAMESVLLIVLKL